MSPAIRKKRAYMMFRQINNLFCLLLMTVLLSLPSASNAQENETALEVTPSIPAGMDEDATDQMNDFFKSIPDGSIVRFAAGARYRIDGTVVLEDKKDVTIEGNGVLFRAVDPGEDHDKKTSYTGWKKTRSRAHWRIKGSQRILVRNVEVHGAHPDAGKAGSYDSSREAQHGFDLVNVDDCTLEKVTVHDVFGDCVYITKSRGVVIRDSKLTRCGRQGIAVATGEDVLIENNEIADSRRGIIDIEPYGEEWRTSNIRIIGNRLGGSRLLLLPMGGSGTVGMIFVADNINTEQNGTPAIGNTGKAGQGRGPLMMINNQFTIGGSPTHGLRIRHNDGVLIAGNELTFPEKRTMTVLGMEGSSGLVLGNRFLGAATIGDDAFPEITSLSNATTADAPKPETQWKRITGGFAVRVLLPNEEVVSLMRGGKTIEPPPETIEGYGQSTAAAFAWFRLRDGKVVDSSVRK